MISCAVPPLLRNRGVLDLLRKHGIDPAELLRCFAVLYRKPGPKEPAHPTPAYLEEQLRTVVGDESALCAVMETVRDAWRD